MDAADYCLQHILVIPQALGALSDVDKVVGSDGSAIYYKDLQQDLVDVEFYTNQLCLVFVEGGAETLTTWQNDQIALNEGQGVLLCQGQNLHSDFVKCTHNLKAWLVFINKQVIERFLLSVDCCLSLSKQENMGALTIEHETVTAFFKQLGLYIEHEVCIKGMLECKLLELLHILNAIYGKDLRALLQSSELALPAKRNMRRLLENERILKLSVTDLAKLSGRSISGFQREFKQAFQQTPKQWLINKRMQYAKKLITRGDMCITTVALEVGYSNVSHFIKAYKNTFGETPKQQALKG
ncbi:hypothetical protein N474_23455 [Pseudoalteromonas luteoviolacea CPMOR-2]|uniref:HTH araC/xylS-type domain-containing protein n=1 Tax=Pseudoalteromonas luteoviolacea DSM 6061 TaxID=1365250 RepID=A0A166Z9M9_9GAMM|nr:AraC family transcriptional regulator [Pseudoalteromonas luteoviolacea]KZN44086.1 hypothetical protein N475_08230 [Pseudoalteromonas luteoviolacea DSM 6061]KZN52175.1 hypothetical protein N474_23455 [Pseudoalteromonas luteoviolacea CPMOR-2]MBE0386199.1 hypothetical protein [Pseudoalteromonas luteoviolacea DSM 6061]